MGDWEWIRALPIPSVLLLRFTLLLPYCAKKVMVHVCWRMEEEEEKIGMKVETEDKCRYSRGEEEESQISAAAAFFP
jgi:hypothetical protein